MFGKLNLGTLLNMLANLFAWYVVNQVPGLKCILKGKSSKL